jgi:hypothetical protein
MKKGQAIEIEFEDVGVKVNGEVKSVKGDSVKVSYFDEYYDKTIIFTVSKEDFENGKLVVCDSYEIFSEHERSSDRPW